MKLLLPTLPRLYFTRLPTGKIEFYVDKYQPYDKAGAYAIQEWIGVVGIKSVTGDFYNVMGLPVKPALCRRCSSYSKKKIYAANFLLLSASSLPATFLRKTR